MQSLVLLSWCAWAKQSSSVGSEVQVGRWITWCYTACNGKCSVHPTVIYAGTVSKTEETGASPRPVKESNVLGSILKLIILIPGLRVP
jgi:hypothetical protein